MKTLSQFLAEKEVIRSSDKGQFDYQHGIVHAEKPGYSKLGSGAFGSALKKNSDDSVYKVYRSDSHDVAAEFHRHAMKETNPHLPKISKMVTVKHPQGVHTVISKMERLYPLHNLSHDELKSSWEHAFGKSAPKDITPSHISDHIERHIKAHSGMGKIPGKATSHFTNAASDIAAIASNGNGKIDIKPENIMVRKNKTGPHHLVINDPVWGGEAESHNNHEYSSGESWS